VAFYADKNFLYYHIAMSEFRPSACGVTVLVTVGHHLPVTTLFTCGAISRLQHRLLPAFNTAVGYGANTSA